MEYFSSITKILSPKHFFFTHSCNIVIIIIPGEHLSYTQIDYLAGQYGSITTMSNTHVLVAQWKPPAAHVHQLPSGKKVRSFSYQELALQEDDLLGALNFTGQLLHLAVGGDPRTIKSLHSYRVQYNLFRLFTVH